MKTQAQALNDELNKAIEQRDRYEAVETMAGHVQGTYWTGYVDALRTALMLCEVTTNDDKTHNSIT